MSKDTLTITDNRTGQSYEVPIENGAIKALDLRKIKAGADDFGLMTYDPGYTNTAACKSRITYIDGDKGILNYRGYPIEQLAEKSTYLETAFLILEGELPGKKEYDTWAYNVTHHTMVHENIRELVNGFRYDAHPMGMLMSTVAALSTYYPEAKNIHDAEIRRRQIFRLIAKMPTLAALAYRHSEGTPFVMPDNDLSYAGNFLQMMFRMTEREYKVQPGARAGPRGALHPARRPRAELLDRGHARGGLVRGRSVLRHRGRHRRPLRPAARRGQRDGAADAQGDRLQGQDPAVHQGSEDQRRRGPAHGLRPPRVQELRPAGQDHQGAWPTSVFEVTGRNPLLDIALELERIALEDEYFVKRKLYPNVDFYSGLIYQSMGFPVDMFPVLFAIPRTAGWLAQWEEMLEDKDQKIARPRQIYLGSGKRDYVPLDKRG